MTSVSNCQHSNCWNKNKSHYEKKIRKKIKWNSIFDTYKLHVTCYIQTPTLGVECRHILYLTFNVTCFFFLPLDFFQSFVKCVKIICMQIFWKKKCFIFSNKHKTFTGKHYELKMMFFGGRAKRQNISR